MKKQEIKQGIGKKTFLHVKRPQSSSLINLEESCNILSVLTFNTVMEKDAKRVHATCVTKEIINNKWLHTASRPQGEFTYNTHTVSSERIVSNTNAKRIQQESEMEKKGPEGVVKSCSVLSVPNWIISNKSNSNKAHPTGGAVKYAKRGAQSNKGNKGWPSGCRIELRGRIKGAAKRTKLEVTKGSIKLQSAGKNIEYCKKNLFTKWGVLGLKIVKAGR